MKIRMIILITFIVLSIILLWLNGRIVLLAGNNIEGDISQFFYKSVFLLISLSSSLVFLVTLAIGGLIYSKWKIANKNYFIGFIYAGLYVAIIALVYLYNIVFRS